MASRKLSKIQLILVLQCFPNTEIYHLWIMRALFIPFLPSLFFFLLEDNCFTILCWPLPYINMNQPQVYTCPLSPEPPSHLSPHPTPPGCHGTRGWALCWHSKFPLAIYFMGFPLAQLVKNPPAMWETWVQSLGWEDPLQKGKAAHSSILAWRILWTV